MNGALRTTVVAALLVAGCRGAGGGSDAGAAASASAASSALPRAAGDGGIGLAGLGAIGHGLGFAQPEPITIPAGKGPPMPAGATPADREKEILALLSGHVDPDALPAVPTDPGAELDRGLRDRLVSPTRFQLNVVVGKPEIHGALGREDVGRMMGVLRMRLRACYQSALKENADLEGGLRVRIEIAPGGDVKKAETLAPDVDAGTRSLTATPALTRCIGNALRGLVFPATDAGTTSLSVDATFATADDTALR